MAVSTLANTILNVSEAAVPGVFAVTLHEVAHGWAAKKLGDPTADKLGRLTLNPLKHIDPIGTVLVPFGLLWLSDWNWTFGWAKPVPVEFGNLGQPKRDLILVAAAGPGANLAMAMAWALFALAVGAVLPDDSILRAWLSDACRYGLTFNVLLMVFNLLPIPPLDGGRVLSGLLPRAGSAFLDRIEPFGFIIVLVLMLPQIGVLQAVLEPPRRFFLDFFTNVAGLRY